ncbi:hypothetical protein BROUX41_006604 [Berkeleyomyces rouxiae]|uniref:uncharacterized protein n=1 Tax=Berkeleyomyces rouxiae TaxID=2035830 RepID=UPI003B79A5F1
MNYFSTNPYGLPRFPNISANLPDDISEITSDDPLAEAMLEYGGSSYHAFSFMKHIHYEPVDEEEGQRQTSNHAVMCAAYNDRLIHRPIPYPKRILDCGAGSCTWAIEVARMYPHCKVTAIDVTFNLVPDDLPPNLEFKRADLNYRLPFNPNTFDVINSRMVVGGVDAKKWESYINQLYYIAKPGGLVQMTEWSYTPRSDTNSLNKESGLYKWASLFHKTMERPLGENRDKAKCPTITEQLNYRMRWSGFKEVQTTNFKALTTISSRNFREAQIGYLNQGSVFRMLDSTIRFQLLYIEHLSEDEINELQQKAQREAMDPKIAAYFNV